MGVDPLSDTMWPSKSVFEKMWSSIKNFFGDTTDKVKKLFSRRRLLGSDDVKVVPLADVNGYDVLTEGKESG